MSHEELISLTQNPTFELAKDFILEGLSFRLNSFENAIKKETRINTEPRTNFKPQMPDQDAVQANLSSLYSQGKAPEKTAMPIEQSFQTQAAKTTAIPQ